MRITWIIGLIVISTTVFSQQPKTVEEPRSALQLLTFKGEFKERWIHLKWSPIANPQSIRVYLVEYSKDGKNFENIGQVFPELVNFYEFKSIIYHAGANYFRIVQVNEDGSALVGMSINVMCGFPDRYHLEVEKEEKSYKLVLQVRNDQRVIAEVLDAKGRLIQSLYTGDMIKNELIFRTIDTSSWAAGTYYISIRGENFRESRKLEVP